MMRVLVAAVLLWFIPATHAEGLPLPDPTRPSKFHVALIEPITVEEFEQFSLSAIKIGRDRRTAIVNGRIVAQGDHLGDAKVLEIGPAGVVLDYRDQRIELTLLSVRVKRAVPETN